MTAWYENARFHMFADCDVFVEDDHYLYVEDSPFDQAWYYACREYRLIENSKGETECIVGAQVGADNEYIIKLEKAPRNIACDIICDDLARWAKLEEKIEEKLNDDDYDNYFGDGITNSELIYDAIEYLKEDGYNAPDDKKFTYC